MKLNMWIDHKPEDSLDTPFSRLKSAWVQVNPEGFMVHGSWAGTWSPEGDKIEFSRIGKKPQSLHLENYRWHILGLVKKLLAGLTSLLPEGMSLPQISSLTLEDHPLHSQSFLDSPQSQKLFLPLFQKFEKEMFRSSEGLTEANGLKPHSLNIEKLKAWLKRECKFQQLLLATLLTTGGGIPPRQLTIEDCRIRRNQSSERNIFIMGGNLTWAWGKQKGIGQKHGCLWSYPPQVAGPVFYYLGVVRPFTIKVLQKFGKSTQWLETNLFARSDSSDHTWYSSYTNSAIQEHLSLPLKLTLNIHDLRQLGQAIMNRHCLPTSQQPGPSIVNQMADHSNWTANKHYGRDDTSNISLPNQSHLDITDMLSASKTYHFWLGFVFAESDQEGVVTMPYLGKKAENRQIAFLSAQSLVPWLYKINCKDLDEARQQAEDILMARKFLHREGGAVSIKKL